uniref:Translation initiation factor eIF2B subunit beta n=1 Tax=Strigamia maritima TaxID=126957 RepID=T1J9F9_STRMM
MAPLSQARNMADHIDHEMLNEKTSTFTNVVLSGKLTSSYDLARAAVNMLKDIVESTVDLSADQLLDVIKQAAQKLNEALADESIVRNMVQRVIKIIQDERTGHPEGEHQESLQKLMLTTSSYGGQLQHQQMSVHGLQVAILDAISELLVELESSAYNIAAQAPRYIHADEVIMTSGKSKTVLAFFKKATKKVKFQVIVAEHAPIYDGQEMARDLAKEGIKVTVITDSSIFAVMSRVNKVILGTDIILANGGLKAANGSHAVALAAKYFSVPLIVCAALFKLSPDYFCSDQDAFNKIASSHPMLNYGQANHLSRLTVENPQFDYVPPNLVTSFISNIGGNAPSYVYRLLNDLYPAEECLI